LSIQKLKSIYNQALNGAAQIARVHLNGLKQLIDLRGDLHSPTMNRYLQRIVMM
jgi:hypothetical protein